LSVFRLCKHFRIWNVDEVMRGMSSRLLTEWMAYFQIENEESEKASLAREASAGVNQMKARRRVGGA
jgi:hypothetical protein